MLDELVRHGEKEITYKVIKKDGVEVSREIVQSKVTKEPINEIIAQGTRRVFASRDGEMEYRDVIYCEATAYAGDIHNCNWNSTNL